MKLSRLLARPMLGAVFVLSGIEAVRDPPLSVGEPEPATTETATKASSSLPADADRPMAANAVIQILAGGLLAVGKLRRLSALALLVTMVPTTYAGHRFWESDEPAEKKEQRLHFLKNLAIAGGLLLEAFDTEGKPSLGWRSRRAARRGAAAGALAVQAAKGSGVIAKAASTTTEKGAEAAESARRAAVRTTKEMAEAAVKAKALKEVAGRALDGTVFDGKALDAKAAKDLAKKAAQTKAVSAVAHRLAH